MQIADFEVTLKNEKMKFFMVLKDGKIQIPLRRRPYKGTGIEKNSIVVGKDYRKTEFKTNSDPFVGNFENIYRASGFNCRLSLRQLVFRNGHLDYNFDRKEQTAYYDFDNFKRLLKHNINNSYARKTKSYSHILSSELDKLTVDTLIQKFGEKLMKKVDIESVKMDNYNKIKELIDANIELDKQLKKLHLMEKEFQRRATDEIEKDRNELKNQVKDIFDKVEILRNRVNL